MRGLETPIRVKRREVFKEVAKILIIVGAIFVPVQAFNTCCYFMLRAGGKVFLTILFDSLYYKISIGIFATRL